MEASRAFALLSGRKMLSTRAWETERKRNSDWGRVVWKEPNRELFPVVTRMCIGRRWLKQRVGWRWLKLRGSEIIMLLCSWIIWLDVEMTHNKKALGVETRLSQMANFQRIGRVAQCQQMIAAKRKKETQKTMSYSMVAQGYLA